MEEEHPFRVLRGDPSITFKIDGMADDAGGAVYARRGGRAIILVSPGLTPEQRTCHLAHELRHHHYGVVSPPASDATMERIEHMVDRDVVDWLVPMDRLYEFVARMSEFGPVEAWMVAEEFSVTDGVARRALERLLERELVRSRPPSEERDPADLPAEPADPADLGPAG